MERNSNEKRKIWVYAVILFTSAFIVLLITAYSQIKLNKNLSNYKSLLSNESKGKSDFQVNLNSALKLNKDLEEQLKSVTDELNALRENQKETLSSLEKINNMQKATTTAYEGLLKAEREYKRENYIKSALILHDKCNLQLLGEEAYIEYKTLKSKTYSKAASQLYYRGYNNYKSGKYNEAIKDLKNSLKLSNREYFSDDCYYFIAYSEYYKGSEEKAAEMLQKLKREYPDSTYMHDVKRLLSEIN